MCNTMFSDFSRIDTTSNFIELYNALNRENIFLHVHEIHNFKT